MFHVAWVSDDGLGAQSAATAEDVCALGEQLLASGATRVVVTEVMPDGSRHSTPFEKFESPTAMAGSEPHSEAGAMKE